ncbi:MAG: hypothetical protein IJ523_10195 [Succinivibrionaceae bacterium]|nr:hypothetical protein [Succinivibrionaceae bacterium]
MSFFEDLFESAANVVSSAATVVKSVPDCIHQATSNSVRQMVLNTARRYKSICRPNMAPDWYYVERAKRDLVSGYHTPGELQDEYGRYDREFQERISLAEKLFDQ